MPSRVDREVWQELNRRMPMVGIGFNGFTRPQTTGSLNVLSEWSIYVTTKNANGNEAMLFGDKFAPGQLSLAEVGASILHAFKVVDIGTVQINQAANSFVEDYKEAGLSITAIELTVPVDLSIAAVLGGDATLGVALTGGTIKWSFDGTAVAQTDELALGVT